MNLPQNVGGIDKYVRILGGGIVAGIALYHQIWWLAGIGALIALTGLVGRCGLYYLLGINTCPVKKGS
jgi:hypothetical protein